VIALFVFACSSKAPKRVAPPPETSSVAETPKPEPAVQKPNTAPTSEARAPKPLSTPDAGVSQAEACPPKPLPKGCPAEEPNVNRPCDKKGVQCIYVAGCCPSPVYVCNKKGRFEARFQRC
jgi:hypothetical protein